MSLTAETKSWIMQYGLHCNKKYRSEMEQIFVFVDEAGKKLNRQIKDLDDIRIAMAALKEIREHQISIDFQVGPIEVQCACVRMMYDSNEVWDVVLESISGLRFPCFSFCIPRHSIPFDGETHCQRHIRFRHINIFYMGHARKCTHTPTDTGQAEIAVFYIYNKINKL